MRKMLLLTALAAFVSCAKKESREAPAAAADKASEATAPRAGLADESRKIIRTGTLRLTVESYDSSRQAIDALVNEAGGFVAASHVSQDRSADLVLRVPSDKLVEIA